MMSALTCVNSKDSALGLFIWERELDFPESMNVESLFPVMISNVSILVRPSTNLVLGQDFGPVNSARSDQGRVKCLDSIGRHDHLNTIKIIL